MVPGGDIAIPFPRSSDGQLAGSCIVAPGRYRYLSSFFFLLACAAAPRAVASHVLPCEGYILLYYACTEMDELPEVQMEPDVIRPLQQAST
jgi:hypothetical protein